MGTDRKGDFSTLTNSDRSHFIILLISFILCSDICKLLRIVAKVVCFCLGFFVCSI